MALAGQFRTVRLAAIPVALAAAWCSWQTWSVHATVDWEWDAGTREIGERMAARPRAAGQTVRVGASGALPHTLNYYRPTRGWTWMEDVRLGADVRAGGFDYYVLIGEDSEWARRGAASVL